jgi:CRISPR-associated protein (Cas_Cas02710)
MVTSFDDKIERMRGIFRGLESYGEGSPSEQATRFRLTEMFPEIIERARKNSAARMPPHVDLLVSLSGFSPATTILAFELVRPERLFVISSQATEDSIDVIHDQLVLGRRIRASHFRHEPCDGTDPLAIYRLVKQQVGALSSNGRRLSAMIDITGGKKVMSAAAALVAWQLDLRLCYIDSRYDGEMRQPIPGTERLLILDNPTTIFGDQEMEAALETFRSGAFAVAQERFAELAESMSEPSRARLLRDVAGMYQAWSDLDFSSLPALREQVTRGLADPLTQVSVETARRISEQSRFIGQLGKVGDLRGVLNFYVLGEHYRELRRMDFAALLYYRTVEECFQQRFKLRFPGFDTGDARFELTGMPEADLLDRFNTLVQEVGRPAVTALPTKLGLMNAAILLRALDDSLLKRINVRDAKGVSYLMRLTEARNKSVLAHGQRCITPNQCDQLRKLALRCLRGLWSLHQPDEDVDELCATLRFVRDI